MRKDVEFNSKGTVCRGWFTTPKKGNAPFPIVIMAGGWCYVREIVMPHYAKFFEDAGLATLIFDYRGFGVSDGEPRQHVDPNMQVEDYKNAISFIETLPEVDSDRIGIWGISMSGGYVLIIGATDPRVKCIVSTIPCVDGYWNMVRAHGTEGFRRLQKTILEDRRRRFKTGKSALIPMTSLDHHKEVCTWPYKDTNKIFLDIQRSEAPLHQHENTIESVECLESYTVFPYLKRILNTPTLMLVAEGDDLTPWDIAIDAFHQVPSPEKKLFIIPKTTHMALYASKSKLQIAAEVASEWFEDHLIKGYQ